MDFDGSLTLPLSEEDSESIDNMLMDANPDENPLTRSPVLVGKTRNAISHQNEEKYDGCYKELSILPECRPALSEKDYIAEKQFDDGDIKLANKLWNVPLCSASERRTHRCEQLTRNVMDYNHCLHNLEDVEFANSLFYESLMLLQDLEDNAKSWIKSVSRKTSDCYITAVKHRTFIKEVLAFVSEFIHLSAVQKIIVNEDSIATLLSNMVMISNQSQVIIDDGSHIILKDNIDTSVHSDNMSRSPVKEWIHSYTDINCFFLIIIPIVSGSSNLESIQLHYMNSWEIKEHNFCFKYVKSLFSQVLKLAIEKFLLLTSSRGNFYPFSHSPFPCHCVQQMLALCIQAANRFVQNKKFEQLGKTEDPECNRLKEDQICCEEAGQLIWRMTTDFVNTIIQDAQNKQKNVGKTPELVCGPQFSTFNRTVDALSFCWWWVWHVSHLFLFDSSGNYQPKCSTLPSSLPLLSRLLRLSLTSCEDDNEKLTSHLMCYRANISLWRDHSTNAVSSTELAHFNLLWTHFSRKMNQNPMSKGPGMYAFTSKEDIFTPTTYLSKCDQLLAPSRCDEASSVQANSYQMFLAILSDFVKHAGWDKLRDRFYSRLQNHDIKTMSETGLSRFFMTFLLISQASRNEKEVSELFSKLVEYVNHAVVGKSDYRKQKVMLGGLFACILVSLQMSGDVSKVSAKCGKMITFLCRLFSKVERSAERYELWKVISDFLQYFSDVCQLSRSFNLGQDLLIPRNSLLPMLGILRSNETRVLFEAMTNACMSMCLHVKQAGIAAIDGLRSLFSNITSQLLPWIKEYTKSETGNSEEVVNLLLEISLVQLLIENKASVDPSLKISELMENFCCNISVKIETRCKFFIQFLSNRDIISYVNSSNACRLCFIQGWIRCCAVLPSETDRQQLSNAMCEIRYMKDMLLPACSELTFIDFVKAIESHYSSSKTILERKERKEEALLWFNTLTDVLQNVSKSLKFPSVDQEMLMTVYKTCAQISQYCSKVLYVKGKSGIIIQIFDWLILPRWIYVMKDKSLPPPFSRALGHTLHVFLLSLLFLDYKMDGYLQRLIRDILTIYLARFPAGEQVSSHPIRKALSNRVLDSERRYTIIKTLRDVIYAKSDVRELALVIEIIHSWATSTSFERSAVVSEIPPLLSLLQQARSTFKTASSLTNKITNLITIFNLVIN